jgi:multiple sugar transport system permease protein
MEQSAASLSVAGTLPRRRSGLLAQEHRDGWLFFLPWLIGFIWFTLGPMLYSIYLLFVNWNFMTAPKWVGLGNFVTLSQDTLVRTSIADTAYFTFIAVPVQLLVALGLALALNQPLRGIRVLRSIFYLPSIVPAIAMAVTWLQILNPAYGILNSVFRALHIPPQSWLLFPASARNVFILMSLWGVGGQTIIFLAGLNGVPQTLYEASSVDGARGWQQFWRITLPLLSPTLFFNLVVGIIGTFQVFTQAFVMTNGGPENATLFAVLYIYQTAFVNFQMGYASVLSWCLFLIIVFFTVIQFRLAGRWVYYEAG